MVVFDMAGTTVNENNVVYKTLQQAINAKGFDISLPQVLAAGAGKEKLQAIKSILSVYVEKEDDQLSEAIYQDFLPRLAKAYDTIDIFPQDNAVALFRALKKRGILVVLNTGYGAVTAQSLISKLGWKKGVDIDGVITASDVKNSRPDPAMILLAMLQFGIMDPGEVIKVGDSVIDIEEGRAAGCRFSIGITTGAHTRDQLESAAPDYVINNLLDLLPVVYQQ